MTGNRHTRTKTWIFGWLLLSLLIAFPLAAVAEKTILVIKSNDNNFFNTSIQTFIDQTDHPVKYNITTLEAIRKDKGLIKQASLIITLGYDAAKFTFDLVEEIPVIHTYLTEFQFNTHEKKSNHSSILLDQPLNRYLKFIKLLLGSSKVGVIKTDNDKIDLKRINNLQQDLQVEIIQKFFKPGDNPVNSVRNILQQSEVLLALPAPDVYNRQSLKGILLASYRMNKPVISYSPAHVKSGALAAIYTTPENIGMQLGEIVARMLQRESFKPRLFYFASDFNISINQQVAESLNLELADEQEILRQLRRSEAQ